MHTKIKTIILCLSLFAGIITNRVFKPFSWIRAETQDTQVYSVNNVTPDSTGNVDVASVNDKTVNANVPDTANFSQYSTNATNLSNIETAMTGLNATEGNVLTGKTFVGSNGAPLTGSMANKGKVTGTVTKGGSFTIPAGYHNGSGAVTGPSLSAAFTHVAVASAGIGKQSSGNPTASISVPAGYTEGYLLVRGGSFWGHAINSMTVSAPMITSYTHYVTASSTQRGAHVVMNGNAGTITVTLNMKNSGDTESDHIVVALLY